MSLDPIQHAATAPGMSGEQGSCRDEASRRLLKPLFADGPRMTIARLAMTYSAYAPHLQSVLRMVAAVMFMLFGRGKLFGLPLSTPANGGSVPLLSQYFSAAGGGPWSLDARRRQNHSS